MSATAALELSLQQAEICASNEPKSLKRSWSGMGSFDFSDFETASDDIKGSITFPSIEWSFDDSDEKEEVYSPSLKRRCR
jgi:hypothetical protein